MDIFQLIAQESALSRIGPADVCLASARKHTECQKLVHGIQRAPVGEALVTYFFGLQKYTDKYIDQGSIAPLVHVMWGVFFLSYAISWPGVSLLLTLHGKKPILQE